MTKFAKTVVVLGALNIITFLLAGATHNSTLAWIWFLSYPVVFILFVVLLIKRYVK